MVYEYGPLADKIVSYQVDDAIKNTWYNGAICQINFMNYQANYVREIGNKFGTRFCGAWVCTKSSRRKISDLDKYGIERWPVRIIRCQDDFSWHYKKHLSNERRLAPVRNCQKSAHWHALYLPKLRTGMNDPWTIWHNLRTNEDNLHNGIERASKLASMQTQTHAIAPL